MRLVRGSAVAFALGEDVDQRLVGFGKAEGFQFFGRDPAVAFVLVFYFGPRHRAAEPEVQIDSAVRISKRSPHQKVDDGHFQARFFQTLTAGAQPRRFARSALPAGELRVSAERTGRVAMADEELAAMLDDGDADGSGMSFRHGFFLAEKSEIQNIQCLNKSENQNSKNIELESSDFGFEI